MNLLCLDLGGTNPRIAMLDDNFLILKKKQITQLDLILQINEFLKECGDKNITTNVACIAVAGVIKDKKVSLTNSKLTVDIKDILDNSYLSKIYLINDFEAVAYGFDYELKNNKILHLDNKNKNYENKIFIGPGTGLGVCFSNNEILKSEAGHVLMPYRKDLSFLENSFNYEHFVSGKGIINIFKILINNKSNLNEFCDITEDIVSNEIFENKNDLEIPLIISANYNYNRIANMTLNIFMSILGTFAQTCSLFYLSKKIIFAGGILPKNQFLFEKKYFYNSFLENSSKNHEEYLSEVSFDLITDYDVSLYGCMNYFKLKGS